jgi:DNA (cytosine-5)-methyltransferase 1
VAGSLTKKEGRTGWLVDEPARFVEALRPTWVAQEQVTGALGVWEEQARLYREMGYHVWTGILTSEQYGVPQTRSRAILMAHLEHRPSPGWLGFERKRAQLAQGRRIGRDRQASQRQ